MPTSVESHSHRNTTKTSHKPFKARKATKGALKEISKGENTSKRAEIIFSSLIVVKAKLKMEDHANLPTNK